MVNVSYPFKPLASFLASSLLIVGGSSAAMAQVNVTGGEASLENVEIFIPDAARANGRDVGLIIDGGNPQNGSIRIQTTQGDLPI
ncbi:MAG: hypothetical protein AAGF93_24225, partial [Cyanobacteria bacterium P01_H01_bin.105]